MMEGRACVQILNLGYPNASWTMPYAIMSRLLELTHLACLVVWSARIVANPHMMPNAPKAFTTS